MTFGVELEWADVPRNVELPPELGEWDYCECDIVNTKPPYRAVAADPLGEKPPVGGEIHVTPARAPRELRRKVRDLFLLFDELDSPPVSTCVAETHVHVRVPGLRDDVPALKRLFRYIYENQEALFAAASQFKDDPRMTKSLRRFFKHDGARRIPEWLVKNIEERAGTFEDVIRLHCRGKDGYKPNRPARYGVNVYCMRHIDTIEFRCFRATIMPSRVEECVQFARYFLEEALGDGEPVELILAARDWDFPPFVYDHELATGWAATKWPKSRCAKKVRKLHEL